MHVHHCLIGVIIMVVCLHGGRGRRGEGRDKGRGGRGERVEARRERGLKEGDVIVRTIGIVRVLEDGKVLVAILCPHGFFCILIIITILLLLLILILKMIVYLKWLIIIPLEKKPDVDYLFWPCPKCTRRN